jgi:signal transduction histidine kinase
MGIHPRKLPETLSTKRPVRTLMDENLLTNIRMKRFACITAVFYAVFTIFAVSRPATAQTLPSNELDSLEQLVRSATDDSLRGRALNKLAFHYTFNEMDKALPLLERGLTEANRHKLLFGKAELMNTKAIYFDVRGEKDSALHYFNQSLAISREHHFLDIEVMSLNGLGLFNWKSGRFDDALSYFFKALEMNETQFPDRKESRANYLSNIGLIFQELRQFDKAIDYHQQALAIRTELGLINGQAISFANLGACYRHLDQFSIAEQYYLQSIGKADTAKNWRMYYSLHDNLANIYSLTGRYDQAIAAYKKSLERPPQVGENPKSDLSAYINLASLYNKLEQPSAAIEHARRGFDILEQHPQLFNFSEGLHYAIAESHYRLGNIAEGSRYMQQYRALLDTVFSEKAALSLAEMEKRYESVQKDNTILQQQQTIQQKELEIQKYTLWSVLAISVVLILSMVVFSLFKRKQAFVRQASLELRLAEQKEVARIQEERLRISRELHDNIGSYLTLMAASVEQLQGRNGHAKEFQYLQDNLSVTMRELRKTVWLLNRQQVSVDEVTIRLRDFFKPLHQNGTRIMVTAEGNTEQNLTEIQTTHLFRIAQEAINNAYKHAGCKQVSVTLMVEDRERLCLTVEDDGKGFDFSKIVPGSGISNMKSRMEELQGELTIHSHPGKGTVIEGCFELKNTNNCV